MNADYISECFQLTDTGQVLWRERPATHFASPAGYRSFNSKNAGKPAGYTRKDGYVVVSLTHQGKKRPVFLHRIVWVLVSGAWPVYGIDHINRIKSDNWPANLRDVPQRVNCANRPDSSTTTGVQKVGNRFIAAARIDGRQKYLGSFNTEQEAGAAYQAAVG